MGVTNFILNFLFPERCISCKKEGVFLCLNCARELPYPETLYTTFSAFDYRNEITKKALWALKYRGKYSLANVFASVLYERMLPEIAEWISLRDFENPLIVPIPLTKKKLRERGYNQALLLAKEFAKLTSFELADALVKTKETPPQMTLSREKRLSNLKDCFATKEKIRDRNILLLDDITTTGATLEEAKKVLLEKGARKVFCATIAH